MDVKDALQKRRAYRGLEPVPISDDTMRELAAAARLSASCFNNQPWRFVFVRSGERLAQIHECLSKGNEWARRASLIIAAFAARDNDCVIREREFYLFDLGMAVSSLLLRATELGLVAHPIAGFDPEAVGQVLHVPAGNLVLTLIIVGKKSDDLSLLNENQKIIEGERPARRPLETVYCIDDYDERLAEKT